MTNTIHFMIRPARITDSEELQQILIACDLDEFGTADFVFDVKNDVLNELNLETNSWVVTKEEVIVGFGFVEEKGKGRLDTFIFVHPQHKGKGIASLLLDRAEARAKRQLEEFKAQGIEEYEFNNAIPLNNDGAKHLLEKRGYKLTRLYSQMSIDIEDLPEEPTIAEGITIRPCTIEDGPDLYDVYRDAFQDSRGHFVIEYDKWIKEKSENRKEPQLWYGAYRNDEMVGFIQCSPLTEGSMWVDLLGVKRSARKLGLGMTLLKLAFHESYKVGYKRIALTVDTQSLTNAHALYERAGMHAVFGLAMYNKKF